jgi:hypothetical protein
MPSEAPANATNGLYFLFLLEGIHTQIKYLTVLKTKVVYFGHENTDCRKWLGYNYEDRRLLTPSILVADEQKCVQSSYLYFYRTGRFTKLSF